MKVKNLIKLSFLLVIFFSFSQCENKKSGLLYDRNYMDEIKAAREDIRFYMAASYIPGGTFAIAKGGKIIYSEGMGLASTDLDVPVTRDTKFRIGEVSSLFTNLIFHRMQKEGLLHEDSTVQFYYPDFTEKIFEVKMHHLAQQTSGIRNPSMSERDSRSQNVPLQKGIEIFSKDSLIAPPGWYQESNMFNYNLLGAIMEKVSGESFATLLEKYVTDTLNLENTVVDNPFITIKGRTDFYDRNFIAQMVNATFRDLRHRAPSEGLLSNAEDLVKFGNAMLFSDYFKEITDEDYFKPVMLYNDIPSTMKNEWFLMTDYGSRTIYGKIGSVTGGTAAILVYPDEELVLACTTNLTSNDKNDPLFKMAQHFLTDDENEE